VSSAQLKVQEYNRALSICDVDVAPLSRLIVSSLSEEIKSNPVGVSQSVSKIGSLLSNVANDYLKDFVSAANPNRTISILPKNLFETLNNVITSNFTGVLENVAGFLHQLAIGYEYQVPHKFYYWWWESSKIQELLNVASQIINIMAKNVKPLSSKAISKESSAFGASLVKLFPDINEAVKEQDIQMQTASDCITLMNRFFAQDFSFCYKEKYISGLPHNVCVNVGNELWPFEKVHKYCGVVYYGDMAVPSDSK